MQKITEKLRFIEDAINEIYTNMEEKFPLGSEVNFYISGRQKKPSTGKVLKILIESNNIYSASAHVILIVDHDQSKKGGRYSARRVVVDDLFLSMNK